MNDCLLAAIMDDDLKVPRLTSVNVLHFQFFSPHHPLMNLSHSLKSVHLDASPGYC